MWISLWLATVFQPAFAEPREARQAEAQRLFEEMQRLSQRTAWSGVERQFAKLEKLRGVEIRPDAYLLGAKAAQGTGNIAAARERAEMAIANAGKDITTLTAASEFLTEFDILNGPVRLDVPSQMETVPTLRAAQPVFDPGMRAALQHANQDLQAERGFRGYLPLGQYRIGSSAFDVLPSEKPIVVIVTPGETPIPQAAPKPVASGPEARMVFLSVRGEGWQADAWSEHLSDALTALRNVDGVQLVDAFGPDQEWLVVSATPSSLEEHSVTVESITAALAEGWTHRPPPVVDEAPPEDTDVQLVEGPYAGAHLWTLAPPYDTTIAGVGERTAGEVPLATVATIAHAETGPFLVPADGDSPARYRIEVKFAGEDTTPLLDALQTLEALQPLGFKVEERSAN